MTEIVISLCDYSGNILQPWADAGYECYAIDLQHEPGRAGNIFQIRADIHQCVSHWLPMGRKIKIAFGAPPCTHTAVSGAKHFKRKGPQGAAEAFGLIARCDQLLKWFDAPWMWEQPVSTTATYCGEPSHYFDPCDFAGYADNPEIDAYTKKTCLWTGNGFVMPTPKRIEPVQVCKQGSFLQKLGGSSLRTKNIRSATPKGFCRAVFEANH